MRTVLVSFLLLACLSTGRAQSGREIGLSIGNSIAAKPFSNFTNLFQTPLHPYIELGYGFNWRTKPRHDWYQQLRLGYFFHRFVQHGIPLYSNIGYRYKFNSVFFAESSLGLGYLHSVPATAKLKLDENGDYKNNTGLGRMQAMAVFNLGLGYKLKQPASKIFLNYQPRIQFPFVRSYVPLMPYNSMMIGAAVPIH